MCFAVNFEVSGGYEGIDDIQGHPQQGAIEFAISERLMDALGNKFNPDAALKRKDFARYAVMGGAVRQYRDLLNEPQPALGNLPGAEKAYLEAVSVTGGALKDNLREQDPVLLSAKNGNVDAFGKMTKLDMAYSMVQLLGLQSMATDFDPTSDITVDYRGETIVLSDQDAIPAELKGYVQAAINLSLINVEFDIEQGAFGLEPTLTATFTPDAKISRVHYAVLAGRLYDYYLN